MNIFRIAAPAKLNLFLHIIGKRPDGYHLLESLTFFTEFGDHLEFTPSTNLTLHITGPMATGLQSDQSENLILRAAKLLQSHAKITNGATITLQKNIPIGAGLGGGSSDAAATLLALNQFWNLSLSTDNLIHLAAQLGSDIPACVLNTPAWVAGTGEQVQPIAFPQGGWLLLLNPNQPLLTADVFRGFHTAFDAALVPPSDCSTLQDLATWARAQHNSLEAPAIAIMPEISELLSALATTEHCMLHRMSGSGATCFGLYETQEHATAAYKYVTSHYPNWWAITTPIKGATHG